MDIHSDQYGLGGEAFEPSTKPSVPEPAPAAANPAEPASPSERPRNPDGTFAAVAPEPIPQPAPIAHPPLLKRLAADLGFTPAEIAATSTADLERDTEQRYAYREQMERQNKGRYREPAQHEVLPVAAPDPLEGIDWGADSEGKPLSKDDFAPGLVGIIGQLKARLDRLEGHVQTQTRQSLTERADKVFNEDAEYFGTGSFGDLEPDGAEMARREAAVAIFQRDKSNLPLEAKLRKARAVLRGDAKPKPAPATPPATATPPEATSRLAAWQEGSVARPTQRTPAKEEKGVPAAKRAFLNGLKEAGLDGPSGEYADEFPG